MMSAVCYSAFYALVDVHYITSSMVEISYVLYYFTISENYLKERMKCIGYYGKLW